MAIERMKKLTILFPVREGERFEEWLYSTSALHLVSLDQEFTKLNSTGSPLSLDEQEAAEKLARVKELLLHAQALFTQRRNFIDSMLPVKTIASENELREALETLDMDALYARVKDRSTLLKECLGKLNLLAMEKEVVREFEFLSRPISEMRSLERTFLILAEGSAARIAHVSRDEEAAILLAWEIEGGEGGELKILFAGCRKDEAKCADILRAHGFKILEYPDFQGRVSDRIGEIAREEAVSRGERAQHEEEMRNLLPPDVVRKLECLKGYWESEKKRAEKAREMVCSKMIGVARGYARASDTPRLISEMEKEFPGVSAIATEPGPGDRVPVSIKLSRWTRPGQLLIDMFGLPDYFSIDPTPYLITVFLIFFGICFADVVYGLLLMFLSWLLMRRYRLQENLREFFRLFSYCGVSTVIFGVLTGSWAADIYNYLGPNNAFQRFVQKTTLLDMLAKPVIALVITLIIGIVNQFYGIVMRIIKDAKQMNWRGVLYDGVLWLVYLGGLLAFAVSSLAGRGGGVARWGSIAAVACGAAGLVLTQGRDEKSVAGKLIFGVVSLYGIVGGYGTVSFIGDVLSYSRLLALGLTTYIVGMSFNIIATLVPQIILSLFPFLKGVLSCPVAGGTLVVGVMVLGHLFNFFLSILSAFVHSARLILLEFFGRFYQGDGRWFQPHGFSSESVELIQQ